MNTRWLPAAMVTLLAAVPCTAGAKLVVHEWGTFTAFQDETGKAMRHINTDDEPVPGFVHRLASPYLFRPTEMPPPLSQGAEWAHPDVTMRLETPVLYFHLPESHEGELTVDVDVQFRGGWLTEYYPNAAATVDGSSEKLSTRKTRLRADSLGRLSWKNLKVGGGGKGPETNEHVWTAPRAVDAANVTAGGESESFLFYRGVATIDAPLRVVRDEKGGKLKVHVRQSKGPKDAPGSGGFPGGWLADVRPDGSCAYRLIAASDKPAVETPAEFPADAYAADNLKKLRGEMHKALVKDGLFADEAEALLNTWELSYFKSPGLRLFFLVPHAWTDHVLPLKLSVDADVTRVMVGRIEIVTPRQRELVRKMASVKPKEMPELKPVLDAMRNLSGDPSKAEQYAALASGRGNPADLGVPVPEIYQHWLDLGRFRVALLWNGQPGETVPNQTLMKFGFAVSLGRTLPYGGE